jgi:hypothetical protein
MRVPDTDDIAILRRALAAAVQRLREIERERTLPPTRDQLARALRVNLATISRWRREGLPPDATPEEAVEWRKTRCHTLQHKRGGKSRRAS